METASYKEALILLAPIIILMSVFIVLPVLSNIYYSFFKWSGVGKPVFIGLDNYTRMIRDERFFSSLRFIGVLILYVPFGVLAPLLLSAVLRSGLRGWQFFRALLYLPSVLGGALLGVVYRVCLSQAGPLNTVLKFFGVQGLEDFYLFGKSWSAVNTLAFLFVIWFRIGFGIIFFLSAMSNINTELFDAADVDG
ncbi:MAG: sugar ABC transporter permease, partial [Treponema sp.]|nr:sugar ABC transporter permease [Treponema sp.]